jgi:cbb3-type cytochrome oxidase maturation protein
MSAADVTTLAIVVGSVVLFGGATVLALGWAFRSGQFDNFQQGASSIFGPDEPEGETTDAFPGADPKEADRVATPEGVGDADGNAAVDGTPSRQRPWLDRPGQ